MDYEKLASDQLSEEQGPSYVPISNYQKRLSAGKAEFKKAKEILSIISSKSNLSLYDHLTAVLKKIIRERIENAVDIFEEISEKVKAVKYVEASSLVETLPPDQKLLNFIDHVEVFIETVLKEEEVKKKVEEKSSESDNEEDSEKVDDEEEEEEENVFNLTNALPDIFFHMSRFSCAGIGLTMDEIYQLSLALKVLAKEYKLEKVRFWGKLFGIHCNYYVAETLYKEDIKPEDFGVILEPEIEQATDLDDTLTAENEQSETEAMDEEDQNEDEDDEETKPEIEENVILPLPISKLRTKVVPPEENGTGVNEYVYFVCTKIGECWRCLPSLKPSHIVEAKLIKQYFRGVLDADVRSSVFYLGKEAHYLRAQIARISASTYICPKDYYTFSSKKSDSEEDAEEEPAEDEEEKAEEMKENSDFKPPSVKSAFADGLDAWVHCRNAILDQGRCTWMGMIEEKDEEVQDEEVDEEVSESDASEKDEEEEEEKEESDVEVPKETSVPLLRSLSEDKALGKFKPWSVKLSSKLMSETAVLIARSNIWPGAYTYFDGKVFETIYIGFGHKFSVFHYAPPIHSVFQKEYVAIGPELTERTDYPIPPEPEPEPDKDDEDEDNEESGESSNGSGSDS